MCRAFGIRQRFYHNRRNHGSSSSNSYCYNVSAYWTISTSINGRRMQGGCSNGCILPSGTGDNRHSVRSFSRGVGRRFKCYHGCNRYFGHLGGSRYSNSTDTSSRLLRSPQNPCQKGIPNYRFINSVLCSLYRCS